ncbi:UNVERIFIED_CONTAM: hypothetical protein FKN15_048086 [Acipenser sinensis]
MDLKAKQVPAAQAPVQAPLQPQLPYPPSPRGVQGGWEEASQLAQEDMLSKAASGEGTSFFSDMQVGETPACSLGSQCPRPVVQLSFGTYRTCCSFPTGPLDASGRTTPVRFPDAGNGFSPSEVPGFPTLHGVLKQAALLVSLEGADKLGLARFPQVDSTIAALVKALPTNADFDPQPFPAFPDFLEEVKCSWQHLASVPSVSKSTVTLASMEGAEAVGFAQFPPVDSPWEACPKILYMLGSSTLVEDDLSPA